MSDTERDALEAGSVWWEGELFRGKPDWQKLLAYPVPKLTAGEEQAFLDNECEQACRLVDDWKVTHELYDLPHGLGATSRKKASRHDHSESVWRPGFSAYAHSQVVTKLSTRSSALSVSVMVPNSLGPAELLLHYGTEEQKNYYLPRLARR